MKKVFGFSLLIPIVCLTGLFLPACQTTSEVSSYQVQATPLDDGLMTESVVSQQEIASTETPGEGEPPALSKSPSNPDQTAIPEGWKTYEEKDAVISFSYLSEWGEVINYLDYFISEVLDVDKYGDVSPEGKAKIDSWKSSAAEVVNTKAYLSFSNLSKEIGANIRILTVNELQFMIDNAAKEGGVLWPFLGVSIGSILLYPDNTDELPQMFQAIVELPEGASDKDLGDVAIPIFILFSNGLRYAINPDFPDNIEGDLTDSSTLFDYSKTYWEQITTCDGRLRGIIEIGAEGMDVAARDYWDCILVPPEADRLVYLSFNLRGDHSHYDHVSVEWPAGSENWETDAILQRQNEILTKFAESITLLY